MLELWLKAFHVIAVISWMAGLLYLPRLFVYHADVPAGSAESETFKIMERRLYRAIMRPAMIASWFLGLWLAWQAGWLRSGWFHAKLALVVGLTICHEMMGGWLRAFAEDRNARPARFFRIVNEVPTLLMIGIVLLVILKPF